MTFTPTLRRSGKRMITVRTTHYVTRAIMVACVAHAQGEIDPDPGLLAGLTRAQVERIVREELGMYGDEIETQVIDYPEEQFEAIDECIAALFPDLD